MHHDFIFKIQPNLQRVTLYHHTGLQEYGRHMNSIRFFVWIMWGEIFDVSEEGNRRKESRTKQKRKTKIYTKISMCMLMPVYLCKIMYMEYMHVY